MATWRIYSGASTEWVANTAYSLGNRVVCRVAYGTTAARARVFECTTAGTSHATTEPTWVIANPGDTTNDNDVVWTCRAPSDGNWLNAARYLHYILNHASPAAGDLVYIHNAHAENASMNTEYRIIGSSTSNNPIRIYCVDKDSSDALSTGAVVSSTYGGTYYFYGHGYSYGVTYKQNGNGSIYIYSSTAVVSWIFEGNGTTTMLWVTASTRFILLGCNADYPHTAIIKNGSIRLDNLNHYIVLRTNLRFEWKGGSIVAANGITNLFTADGYSSRNALIEDVDLTQVGKGATATALVKTNLNSVNFMRFNRCKLPTDAGFTKTVGAWPSAQIGQVRFHHCSGANKTYDFAIDSYEGTVIPETTIVRTGGASDGTTPISMKAVSSANTLTQYVALELPPIDKWTNTTSSTTYTVEGVIDNVTLTNAESWMEVEYPANNTDGLGAVYSTRCAPLGTPANLTTSSVTWTTTGMGTPVKFKLQATIAPGKVGPIQAKVYLSKPSTTVYIDPMITES